MRLCVYVGVRACVATGKGTAGITIATEGDRDASTRDMATANGHGRYLPSRIGS